MPKQLFQRPAALKLSKGGKNNSFGGQPDWGRKKGKPKRIEVADTKPKAPTSDQSTPKTKPQDENK